MNMRKILVILLTTFSLVLTAAPFANAALPAYQVTISLNKTVSEAGQFVIVSGKVIGPNAAGKNVTIQRRYVGGAWTTVATARIRSTGGYRATVETPRGGTTSFRVLKARSSVRRAGVSATRSLPVNEWLYLANEGGFIISGNVLQPTEQTIGGVNYTRSMNFFNGDTAIKYKLGGMCSKFATQVAYQSAPDAAPDTMVFGLGLEFTGSNTQTTTSVDVNTSAPVAASVVGARSMDLNMSDIVDTTYIGLLGNPRVYCNADHLPSFDSTDF